MSPGQFPLDQYLDRVGLAASASPTEDFLADIQRAQVTHLPFENFDICLGRGVDVSADAIVRKLVHQPRGGYCFELNGLLLMALHACGFRARAILARVHLSGTPTGRSHQLALVSLGKQQWLVDTGFGANTPRAPIRLEPGLTQQHGDQSLRLLEDPQFGVMLQSRIDGQWVDLYSSDLSTVCAGDIQIANHFTSTWPGLHFTTSRMASLVTQEGLVTLSNFNLREHRHGILHESTVAAGEDYLSALSQHFGIELDAEYEALAPLPP